MLTVIIIISIFAIGFDVLMIVGHVKTINSIEKVPANLCYSLTIIITFLIIKLLIICGAVKFL